MKSDISQITAYETSLFFSTYIITLVVLRCAVITVFAVTDIESSRLCGSFKSLKQEIYGQKKPKIQGKIKNTGKKNGNTGKRTKIQEKRTKIQEKRTKNTEERN